ncbi:MAG: hypothetical protein ACFB02_13775 [Mastigocoleus sp.]
MNSFQTLPLQRGWKPLFGIGCCNPLCLSKHFPFNGDGNGWALPAVFLGNTFQTLPLQRGRVRLSVAHESEYLKNTPG